MKRQRFFRLASAVALGVVFAAAAQAAPKVDPQLKLKLRRHSLPTCSASS